MCSKESFSSSMDDSAATFHALVRERESFLESRIGSSGRIESSGSQCYLPPGILTPIRVDDSLVELANVELYKLVVGQKSGNEGVEGGWKRRQKLKGEDFFND